jgi:hypothetical protein
VRSTHTETASTSQQQSRLDRHQHRRHDQVLGRQLQVGGAHRLDVFQVLARERRHRNVEDVEILLANQVQQQVERALERLQDHFQRIGRDVEILGDLDHRLAVEPGHVGGARERCRIGHQE